ncbi:hypothetical protein B0F90DRAFT_266814 [Multifurca ochricompacta]|uniref:Uncharacterized protein n=1 Tax=Multifurca ochricompacta TaxID=376703 RepID=A0AAD4M772_9AGAM|nr:hypothetical protein B0F90DRAFT_266814 [Multifurca ochricompacta]
MDSYSYRRWVKDEEDVDRLPHGMVRTGYDADTRQYTFHDTTTGVQFVSAPGEAYGTLLPASTAKYVKPSRGAGRRLTLQAYDRPVIFADDIGKRANSLSGSRGHKSAPSSPSNPSSTHSPRSSSTNERGPKRSATFADILPSHLIASAPSSPVEPRDARRSPSPKKSPSVVDEKSQNYSHMHSLPHSSPPMISPPPVSREYPGEKQVPPTRDAFRSTVRMIGRTLAAVKGHRSHGVQRNHDGYVVV